MGVLATRKGLLLLLWLLVISLSFLTRIVLMAASFSQVDASILNLAGILFFGFLYDLINAFYFSIPLVLYLWLVPDRRYIKPWQGYFRLALFLIFVFILTFNAIAEWFFWDEFNVRFNFIAVDYLVYTTEVIGNVTESYPMGWIIATIVLVSGVIVYSLKSFIAQPNTERLRFRSRTVYVVGYGIVFTILFFGVSTKYHRFSKNAYVNELAGNGMYELFAAYLNNELDYDQFYARLDNADAFNILHNLVTTSDARFTSSDSFSIERVISNAAPEIKKNVVLISVESFSADFMKLFGNKENITPFLDSLSNHSLVFTNLYATGTRTVRGLEALSLCVPPTPGQSIVRRPENEDLFSLGKVFNNKGYKSEYIYGGYSYFDNMGYFFGHNNYEVVDRSKLSDEDIDYENIWGVADENLFDLALRQLDEGTQQGSVFAHVMTTSNHRPFTYPDGRIDIPSHTGRRGAVKYTDYAIGKFITKAVGKPWFHNTIFVIVADHCASSAGKNELPVEKYHIPMLIYSPGFIQPGVMNRLMSQIDIGPTLLGLLHFSYKSKFYGYDMFKLEEGRERAFISTYQSLGYLKKDRMVILSPQLKVKTISLPSTGNAKTNTLNDQVMINEAIAWYQSASYAFKHKLMN